MGSKLRKFLVGFISLTVVLAIYLLYSRIGKTPPIDIEDTVADSNIGYIEGEIGRIGDIGVGALKRPKFIHRNKNKEIDREFGFEELLHQVKGQWEVEKPYMNIYQNSFNCFISADRGKVQVETAVGRPIPKNATFTDNVVIHILPQTGSDIKESFVYLDDISFISDRTLFSSEGPVKFVSEDAQMLGTGLELVYNDRLERLEFLRIVVLESLRLKSSESTLFSQTKRVKKPGGASTAGQEVIEQPTGEYYKCVFSKNVAIDTPEQLIFADDEVCINDIFWAKASSEKSSKAENADPNTVSARDTAVTKQSHPDELSQQSVDIVVTCDGGVVITPMSLPRLLKGSDKIHSDITEPGRKAIKKLEDAKGRSTFIARQIDCSASTGDVVATGRSQLTFYTSDMLSAEADQPTVPVKIIAQRQTKFLPASNQVIFEGDCLCSMLSSEPNSPEKYTPLETRRRKSLTGYTLSAPKLAVELSKDKAKQSSASTTAIEHFTATGGVVIEVTPIDSAQDQSGYGGLRPDENDVSQRAKFIAEQIDYNASANDIVAAGPTELTFYATDITDANGTKTAVPVKITAQKQTKYLLDSQQVIFDGDCICSMLREDPNSRQKYTLSAPKLTVNLGPRVTGRGSQIEHLTAAGGVVRLATVKSATRTADKSATRTADKSATRTADKSADDKLLSGIELKCRQFDFDDVNQIFIATGPGVIKFANAVASGPNRQTARFSLRRPCWALFEDFDTLHYYLKENQIIVDAKTKKIKIGYVPIVKGKYGQPVRATAGQVQAILYQSAEGQTELAKLFASGGITFEDDKNQFAGSNLFYDHKKAIMKVKGSEAQPCIFNGVLVKRIEYNLKTGKVKAKIAGPGIMQLR